MTDYDTDDIAAVAIDAIDALGTKALVVVFPPSGPPGVHELYSNAAAARLLPVLRALTARIEAGSLRMPVDGGVRWAGDAGPS